MSRSLKCVTLSLLALAVAAPAARSETTRTLKLEMAAGSPFAVENLAGKMRVVQGSGDKVVATAVIHAESDEIAKLVRFEQVSGEKGAPTLRVIYPTDTYSTFRYPAQAEDGGSWLGSLLGGSSTSTEYAGKRVKVSDKGGVLLYADLEVRLPRRALEATFRNLIGKIEGEGVEGTLLFDAASADTELTNLRGKISVDTGSGDVHATGIDGNFSADCGSGDIELSEFTGEGIDCDVGSGDVSLQNVVARRINVDTGSGDVEVTGADVEEFQADCGSGDITLMARGERLARVSVDSSSGDVWLGLGPAASFEAVADMSSGDITSRYPDAEPIRDDGEVVGYRRGSARTKIHVNTGSGDLLIEPGR